MEKEQAEISRNATKGIPKGGRDFGPKSKGAKRAEEAKKKAEEATKKAREDAD